MKIISHRGNINGPVLDRENRPSYIDCALAQKYDVEVDIRYIDGKFYLGHDTPDYEVSTKWINLRKENIWFHCKDSESAYQLSLIDNIKYFCHNADDFVLVSSGNLWVHNFDMITKNSIIPLLEMSSILEYGDFNNIYGVCTDYPSKIIL